LSNSVKSTDATFRAELDRRKRESVGQLLFKCARLWNEAALARVRAQPGAPAVRASHTALFPHIDLDGIRLTDIASRAGVTKQAVGQTIDDLERMGIVERLSDPKDGRAKLVRFSARGRRGLLHGLGVLREIEAELASKIGRSRMRALHELLARTLAVLEASPRR
jgi:DNA-binding MarR family transcriptional regulator